MVGRCCGGGLVVGGVAAAVALPPPLLLLLLLFGTTMTSSSSSAAAAEEEEALLLFGSAVEGAGAGGGVGGGMGEELGVDGGVEGGCWDDSDALYDGGSFTGGSASARTATEAKPAAAPSRKLKPPSGRSKSSRSCRQSGRFMSAASWKKVCRSASSSRMAVSDG